MADTNTYKTIGMVTRRAMMVLKNSLNFTANANRKYDNQFAQVGAKIGAVLPIREPTPFLVRSGAAWVGGAYVESTVSLVVNNLKGCDIELGILEQTINFDDYSRRVLEPMVIELANEVDRTGMAECYLEVANSIGGGAWAAGAWTDAVNTWDTYMYAGSLLDDFATPRDGRRAVVLDQWEQARIVIANKPLFNSTEEISNQYENGTMGKNAGFKWSMDQNTPTHTTGPRGGTPVVDLGGQTGSVINTKTWTAAAALRLRKGDVFQMAGVFAVNPRTRLSTGRLQDFVVTADTNSTAGGLAAIPISPAIVLAPDPRQTVTASPIDGAALSFVGTASTAYKQNLAYHTDAFTLATVDLVKPSGGVEWARATDPDMGLTMQSVKQFDIKAYTDVARLDMLWGWKTIRPSTAVRVWSKIG